MLGYGEIDYLNGNAKKGENTIRTALSNAEKYQFGIEKEYARQLLKGFKTGQGFPFNLP
jgi:hypothetical protein